MFDVAINDDLTSLFWGLESSYSKPKAIELKIDPYFCSLLNAGSYESILNLLKSFSCSNLKGYMQPKRYFSKNSVILLFKDE